MDQVDRYKRSAEDIEMSDEAGRGRGLVPVQYHQFEISDEAGPAGAYVARDHNGLVRVTDDTITVMTGIHTGDVEVTVILHERPPAPDSGHWQEIVEISAHSASGELMVRGIMDDLDEELPVLSFNGPGDYRLRIHAHGRDSAVDLAPNEVTEWYLIQAWPAPTQEVAVLRQSDTYGATVRAH
ncbi:hypothetical protein [Streptomyces iakyrus]|uniref:hypothetical protein n=1 Tax=Streptomyces iakyrus TaxID=68219 RepID=UPI003D8B7FED